MIREKGKTIAVDANLYEVAIVPPTIPTSNTPGDLKAGDIVVTNIGNTDTGTTLVRFLTRMGPGQLFNTVANPGTKEPQGEAFNSERPADLTLTRSKAISWSPIWTRTIWWS